MDADDDLDKNKISIVLKSFIPFMLIFFNVSININYKNLASINILKRGQSHEQKSAKLQLLRDFSQVHKLRLVNRKNRVSVSNKNENNPTKVLN